MMQYLIRLPFIASVLIFGFCTTIRAQTALQSMVDAERAFAKMAEEKGIRQSFMAYIADDGILFRPRAVRGKQWMAEHALPPSDKHPLLSWQPTFADISRAGDIGYTTGPWQFKNDVRDAEATAFGNFLTVWKRQADDSWKFVIDLGITNPAPAQRPSEWTPQSGNRSSSSTTSVSVAEETSKLLALEREFSQSSARDGALRAFRSRASERVRVFRNGQQPAVGKQSALALLPSRDVIWTWEPAYADVSKSGDLAYSYGTYRIAGAAAASNILESGNYYRIWKKEGKTWKVATDLLDPVKESKQN